MQMVYHSQRDRRRIDMFLHHVTDNLLGVCASTCRPGQAIRSFLFGLEARWHQIAHHDSTLPTAIFHLQRGNFNFSDRDTAYVCSGYRGRNAEAHHTYLHRYPYGSYR